MKKIDLLYGVLIGFIITFIGTFSFIKLFTPYSFENAIWALRLQKELGKLIALGGVLNLGVFFLLLHYKKEMMARGVVLAILLLSLLTIFI